MDLSGFLDYARQLLTKEELAVINSKLIRYASRGVEPCFVIQRREVGDMLTWVLTFDDTPDLWIRVGKSQMEMMDFCDKLQLTLTRVDRDYRH